MLFSEIYNSYFNAAAAILAEAVRHTLTAGRLEEIIREKAFAGSVLSLPAALRSDWPLLEPDLTTPLRHAPSMPLTLLQKRWMKSLLLEPRIALFDLEGSGLEGVEPLFRPSDIVRFDQYLDGDPYTDPAYIAVFRLLLAALREERLVRLRHTGGDGKQWDCVCLPRRIEYSEKDGKFRLLASGHENSWYVNIARIHNCLLLGPAELAEFREPERHLEDLVFLLWDERNALERVLLHFSHFEKETVRLGDREYQVTLRYEIADETELLIRVLSFGPMLRVTAPQRFIRLIRERLEQQV